MTETQGNRLKDFPITFFAVVMGLMGMSLAFHAAAPFYGFADPLAEIVMGLGIAAFAVITALYLAKALRYPQAVRAEWQHPVRLAFFPTFSISLLLIATAMAPHSMQLARSVWLVAVGLQGVLTLSVISGWISHRSFEVGHLTPAWFIPAVGNVIVPVAGAGLGYIELSWAFFAVGMLFWGVLLTLVMNRLVFHDPIPARLFPTMMILIAPPSVAFVAYVKMTGGVVDGFARVLIYIGYFFAALLVAQMPRMVRMPFALSWWALSFPLASLAIASFLFAHLESADFYRGLGALVLVILVAVVIGLILRTGLAILRGEICKPE
ncbi:MAG: SLAC1 anion channel family protein [Maritimibacter sp.]|jgi:tellurite resistance protein